MDIKDLEQLVSILKGTEIAEFEYEKDGTSIRISRSLGAPSIISAAPQYIQTTAVTAAGPAVAAPVAQDEGLVKVESPMVGTFYRKSSPEAEPFCEVGSKVKKGDTLCIVEAMKLMNEIESPASGVIEKIQLSDGQVVEYGEVIFLIRPA